jgi:hypothetical protein
MIEFTPWPSIARLHRDTVITEKIDGSNSAVVIYQIPDGEEFPDNALYEVKDETQPFDTYYAIAAQSRKRIITVDDDNFGFAKWVRDHAKELFLALGEGTHFGEWWGSGIQRGYGLTKGEKRFSLFNTPRWRDSGVDQKLEGLGLVPELYVGDFDTEVIKQVMADLHNNGSKAAPGFMRPEGIVIYHTAARAAFKSTFDDCDVYGFNGGKTWRA